MSRAATYQSWHSMLRRCTWPSHKDYPFYGGRGITMQATWCSFAQFLEDLGERPAGTSLDRIDNSKGYTKENCRWATASQQARNKGAYNTNTSGCKGVSWQTSRKKWLVSRMLENKRYTLYWGVDFFEACCVTKAWDLRHE